MKCGSKPLLYMWIFRRRNSKLEVGPPVLLLIFASVVLKCAEKLSVDCNSQIYYFSRWFGRSFLGIFFFPFWNEKITQSFLPGFITIFTFESCCDDIACKFIFVTFFEFCAFSIYLIFLKNNNRLFYLIL